MRASWLFAAAAAALLASLAWPLVAGRVFWYDDLANFHIPLRHLYQHALVSGDSLLWTPAIFAGFYIHGEGQVGLLHPWHLVLYRLLPLTLAINVEFVTSYVAAFAGMYVWLRRLALRQQSALFGAMTFAGGTFLVLHHHHLNLVAVAAHLPWLLVALDVLVNARASRRRAGAYTAVALLVASQVLLGFPQAVWFNLLAAGAFLLFRAVDAPRPSPLLVVVAAVGTGLLLGAVQLLPTVDAAASSVRPLLGSGFSGTLSLHPANLVQLVSPYLFSLRVYNPVEHPFLHEYAIYPSAAVVVLPFWLWIRWPQIGQRRRMIVLCLGGGGLALVLALGRYAGVNGVIAALPGLRWIRGSTRYVFLFHTALIVCAAIAFDDLLRTVDAGGEDAASPRPRQLWPLWIPAALSAAVTGAIGFRIAPIFPAAILAPFDRAALGPAFFLGATGLIVIAARGNRFAPALLALFTALDLGRSGVYEIYRVPPRTIASIVATLPAPPAGQGRVATAPGVPATNVLTLNGFRVSSGYAALEPATYLDRASSVALRLSGTRWRWEPGKMLEPVSDPLPRARLLADAWVVPLTRLGDTRGVQLQFITVDPARTAVVDRVLPPLTGPAGRAAVRVDRPGYLVARTTTPGFQVLALTERFHEGWRAFSDGTPLQTLRIHGDFLGCLVPAGDHRVEFVFRPRSFTQGLVVSSIGFALLAAAVGALLTRSP